MVLRYIFYAFLAYLGFRLIFDLIIPIVTTTRKIKKQFAQAREQMEQQQYYQQQQHQAQQPSKPENVTDGIGDYIEFEEIKKDK
jgi:hypothetical protein